MSSIEGVREAEAGSLAIMVGASDVAFGQLEQVATAELGVAAGVPLR